MKRLISKLDTRVAFGVSTGEDDGYGGQETSWVAEFEAFADIQFEHGAEAVLSDALTGVQRFKVRLHSSANTRKLTARYQMRTATGESVFNIRSVDAISDRRWVWLKVESGVAV